MRTIPFSEILYSTLQMCGLDRNLTTADRFSTVRDFVSRRLQTIWESQDWPDQRRYVKCDSTLNEGRRKVTLPVGFSGQVLAVWNKDPLAWTAVEKDFSLYDGEVYLVNDADATVWVEYRMDAPKLFGTHWKSATTYSKGAQCYYDTGAADTIETGLVPKEGCPVVGNFYEYTGETAQSGQIPPIGVWQLVQIPRIFGSYLIHGCHADYLRSQGQMEEARAAEADASQAFDEAVDQVLRQQGQTRKINFRNY